MRLSATSPQSESFVAIDVEAINQIRIFACACQFFLEQLELFPLAPRHGRPQPSKALDALPKTVHGQWRQ